MVPLLFSGFLYSMRTAAALVRNDIATVIAAMRRVTPTNEKRWNSEVARPALELHKTLMLLSGGWGRGFFGVGLICWSMGLGFFCNAINLPRGYLLGPQDQPFSIFGVIVMTIIPLILAYDVAHTSHRCDTLMEELNNIRIASGEEYHTRLEWLELALKNLNRGQGLGFTIGSMGECLTALRSYPNSLFLTDTQLMLFSNSGGSETIEESSSRDYGSHVQRDRIRLGFCTQGC